VLKISSSDKHKHKTLSAKAEIIKKLDKGEKFINLAKEYGVGSATIYDIKKDREKIESFVKYTDSSPSDR
jgi:Mor family transcriptional regulator